MVSSRRQRKEEKNREISERRKRHAELALEVFGRPLMTSPAELGLGEKWWVDRYTWLKEKGYVLRQRYTPNWIPSWEGTSKSWDDCEDSCVPFVSRVIMITAIAYAQEIIGRLPI